MVAAVIYSWARVTRYQLGPNAVRVSYPFLSFGRDFSVTYPEIRQVDVTVSRNAQRICMTLSGGRVVSFEDADKWTVNDFVTEIRSRIQRSSDVSHPLSDEAVLGD
jgi:hypothetical protein